jgi:hypothetical protein
MQDTASQADASPAFEDDLRASMAALRAAVGAVVEALPSYPRRAPDLARQLGLERNLAWKMFRLINETDALDAARFVPGAASIDAFLEAASRGGVKEELASRVRETAARHAEVVRLHAGDRASADIMLGARGGEAAELALRRGAFRAASYVAGVQAQTHLQAFILAPSATDPNTMDGVGMKGFVDLRRMRPDAPVVVGKSMATDDAGNVLTRRETEPVDGPLPAGRHVALLEEFCSQPLPAFRRVPGERGFIEDELVEGPVGKTGSITFMAGDVLRSFAPRFATGADRTMDMVTRVRTPAAVLVCDLLVHEALFGDVEVRASVYDDLLGDAMRRGAGGAGRERYRLGSLGKVERLGRAPGAVQSPDVPRYVRMMQHVMDRLRWEAERFVVHRVRIEMPFLPTSVVMTIDLPERG